MVHGFGVWPCLHPLRLWSWMHSRHMLLRASHLQVVCWHCRHPSLVASAAVCDGLRRRRRPTVRRVARDARAVVVLPALDSGSCHWGLDEGFNGKGTATGAAAEWASRFSRGWMSGGFAKIAGTPTSPRRSGRAERLRLRGLGGEVGGEGNRGRRERMARGGGSSDAAAQQCGPAVMRRRRLLLDGHVPASSVLGVCWPADRL